MPGQNDDTNRTLKGAIVDLLHPITLVALIILLSVLVLIGAGLFGWDRGQILVNLSKSDYARGLITYLFAVGTIGIAVVLVLAALLGQDDTKEKFTRGKEVLSLLIGVFGTMVGFYFGSQVATAESNPAFQVAPLMLSDTVAESGEVLTAATRVSGGRPPYSYWVSVDDVEGPVTPVDNEGWILARLLMPEVTTVRVVDVRLGVRDASADSLVMNMSVTVRPPE